MSLPPGSTIGILGGGQLGRMMALAAARIGYQCHIFDPHERPCAAEVSAHFTRAEFDDKEALRRFTASCDVVTYEFENLPVEPLRVLGDKLKPGLKSLAVAQDRGDEKRFLEALFKMTYDNPKHREMMDMEGLKAWLPGRTSGFELLASAVEHQRFFSP